MSLENKFIRYLIPLCCLTVFGTLLLAYGCSNKTYRSINMGEFSSCGVNLSYWNFDIDTMTSNEIDSCFLGRRCQLSPFINSTLKQGMFLDTVVSLIGDEYGRPLRPISELKIDFNDLPRTKILFPSPGLYSGAAILKLRNEKLKFKRYGVDDQLLDGLILVYNELELVHWFMLDYYFPDFHERFKNNWFNN